MQGPEQSNDIDREVIVAVAASTSSTVSAESTASNASAVSDASAANDSNDISSLVPPSLVNWPETSLATTSFRDLRESGQVYVDKTKLIARLINDPRRLLTIIHSIGFGKSLLISTMDELYRTQVGPLFDGLAIKEQHLCPHIEQHQYKVLNINFFASDITDPNTFEKTILSSVLDFCRTYNLTVDTTRATAAMASTDRSEILLTISEFLPAVLQECGPRSTVVLVDRYDGPLLRNVRLSKWDNCDHIRNTLNILCQALTTQQDNIEKALILGWLHYHYMEIFGDCFCDLSYDPDYQDICGFTMAEISHYYAPHIAHIAEHFGITVSHFEHLLAKYYDGYSFSPEAAQAQRSVCNPLVILMLFNSYDQYPDFVYSCPLLSDIECICFRFLRFYGDPEAKYTERNGGMISVSEYKLQALERLCVNMPIKLPLESCLDLGEFMRRRLNLGSYMMGFGYFFFKSGVEVSDSGEKYCYVGPPNQELWLTYKVGLFRVICYNIGFDTQVRVRSPLYIQGLLYAMQICNAEDVLYALNKLALNLNSKARELLGDNSYSMRAIMHLCLVAALMDHGRIPENFECGEMHFIDIQLYHPEPIHQLWYIALANSTEISSYDYASDEAAENAEALRSDQNDNIAMIMTRAMTDIQHLVEDDKMPAGYGPEDTSYLVLVYDAKDMHFYAKYVDINPKTEPQSLSQSQSPLQLQEQDGSLSANQTKPSWWRRILGNIF